MPSIGVAAAAVRPAEPLAASGAAGGVAGSLELLIEGQTRFGYERTATSIAPAPDRTFATAIAFPQTGAYRLVVRGSDGVASR